LEESRISEEVKVNSLGLVVFSSSSQFVKETVNDLSFTTSSVSDKHRSNSNSEEVLHNILGSDSITSRNGVVGNSFTSIDTVLNRFVSEVVPVNELGVLSIYVVIEDCSLGGEFDSLELLTPELIEGKSALITFLDL